MSRYKPPRPHKLRSKVKRLPGHPLDERLLPDRFIRHQLVVPTHYNAEGDELPVPVDRELLDEYVADCVLLADGVTIHGEPGAPSVAGVWVGGGGALYREPVMTITVDGRYELSAVHEYFLQRIAYRIAEDLDQEAVYYVKHPIDAVLISAKPRETFQRDMSELSLMMTSPDGAKEGEFFYALIPITLVEKYDPRFRYDADLALREMETGGGRFPALNGGPDGWIPLEARASGPAPNTYGALSRRG